MLKVDKVSTNNKKDPRAKYYYWMTKTGQVVRAYPAYFPLEVFYTLQCGYFKYYTSTNFSANTYVTSYLGFSDNLLASLLKNFTPCGNYFLLEKTAWNFNANLVTLSLYSRWNADTRLLFINKTKQYSLMSVSNIYSNAVWLEREVSEMYDVAFIGLKDTRKLLLEYSTPRGVLKSNIYNQASYNTKVKNTITVSM